MTERFASEPPELPVEGTGDLADKRRVLQLETLYDLLVALHSHRSEQELLDDLLQRVCSVVDPATAVAVTRDAWGEPRTCAVVGWEDDEPKPGALLEDPLWQELLSQGSSLARSDGELVGRPYRQVLAAPLAYRGVFLGFIGVLDKESRGVEAPSFSREDRRFLDSVAVLAGVTLDSLRQMESLVTRSQRLEEENKLLRERLSSDGVGRRIVATAPAMRRVLDVVERVAPRGVSVLIGGESGTGKELVARLLHERSGRTGPLVALNCAALPESLLETELFGIERGVATGVEARIGRFELAQGGTLFLDEIGDLQVPLQVKLLRALQEREITRVGGSRSIPIDVRLVTATHRTLSRSIEEGAFREDLYYRIRGVEVELPPLRERRQDIPHLMRFFVERFCEREGLAVPQIDQDVVSLLLSHEFPGNVRELENLIEGAVSLSDGRITVELLHSLMGGEDTAGPQALDLETVQRRHIRKVLRMTGGNKSSAARILGLDRRTLSRKGF